MNRWMLLAVLFPAMAAVALPRHKQAIEQAPPPAEVVQAKTVYLRNGLTGGEDELAFNALYTDMKQWGRYALVDSPEKADLVLELDNSVEGRGGFGSYNRYSQTVQTYPVKRWYLTLRVFEGKSGVLLWTESMRRMGAVMEGNRQKEVLKTVSRLVDRLKQMAG